MIIKFDEMPGDKTTPNIRTKYRTKMTDWRVGKINQGTDNISKLWKRYKKQKYNFGEHWTRMFLVARPRSQKMWDKISNENKEFRDMVVINIDENYFSNPTIKILAAFKFVSCFCPNAKYFVKSDDDNFIDMAKLEETITSVQKQVDSRYLKQFLKSFSKFPSIKDSIPFYVGASNPYWDPIHFGKSNYNGNVI